MEKHISISTRHNPGCCTNNPLRTAAITIHENSIAQFDSIHVVDEIDVLEKRIGMGNVQIYMDSSIMSINANALVKVKHLKGYRVQIHFGDLESAREVRAKCRHELAGKKSLSGINRTKLYLSP